MVLYRTANYAFPLEVSLSIINVVLHSQCLFSMLVVVFYRRRHFSVPIAFGVIFSAVRRIQNIIARCRFILGGGSRVRRSNTISLLGVVFTIRVLFQSAASWPTHQIWRLLQSLQNGIF
jgi:putative exporter of polyketide antibiotics